MADTPETSGPVMPPKLDLRKFGTTPSVPSVPAPAPTVVAPSAPAPVPTIVAPASAPVAPGGPATLSMEKKPVTTAAPRPPIGPRPPQPQGAIKLDGMGAMVAATSGAAAKKETSKIPLEAAKMPIGGAAPLSGAGGPKTIRIKPSSAAVPGKIAKPPSAMAPAGAPAAAPAGAPTVAATASAEASAIAKRTTSRISLDAVLGPEAAAEAVGGPKTIRLKRPGDSAAPKLTPPGAAEGPVEQTMTPTVKKTVRVKRPSEAEAEAAAEAPVVAQGPVHLSRLAPVEVNDEPNFAFPVLALVAVLCLCVLIYMFLSQCIGPNFSLSEVSMGAHDMDLPWPGKLGM